MTLRRLAVLFVTGSVLAWLAVSIVTMSANAHEPWVCRKADVTIHGDRNDNVLVGTPDRDVISAKAGSDALFGLSGRDLLCGGRGADRIDGGNGIDHGRGGRGADQCEAEHRIGC